MKYLGLALVMLLGLYPIVELTRVIIVSGQFYFPEMKGQFAAEIAVMWILYLSIVPVFLLFNNRRLRFYRRMRNELLKRKETKNYRGLSASKRAEAEYIRVEFND